MTAEADFFTRLSGNAGVTAQVCQRIYPDVLPEDCAYPAIVFARSRTEPLQLVGGPSGYAEIELAVGCWAKTRTAADAAAIAVQAACTGSAFSLISREAALDAETGLFAATLAVSTFAAD